MPRRSSLRIVGFAAASLALALLGIAFVIDAIVERDVREEMSETLRALQTDFHVSFGFFIEYNAHLAAYDVGEASKVTEASLEKLRDLYSFERLRLLKDGKAVMSAGGGTNLVVRSAPLSDGKHSVEVGVDVVRFSQRELGALLMAQSCENWPKIIDGYLLCFRRDEGRLISSSAPSVKAGVPMKDIIADFESLRNFRDGEFFNATVGGVKCLCLMTDCEVFRYMSVVPLSAMRQYVLGPLIEVGSVLLVLVAAFALVGIRLSTLTARLRSYIEGEKTRMRDDLAAARLVQSSALPPPFPRQFSYAVKARMDPAKVVGGDFYDYQVLPNGNFYFLVADVSGKGISAAMFMMRAKSVIKQSIAETNDLAKGMTKANSLLAANNDSKLFVTVWIGILDPRTGYVKYVNAGHNPPVVRRANGGAPQLEWVKCQPSLVLALMSGVEYPVHSLTLAPGDTLFLYTDGVTEAQNMEGRFYGEQRLERVLGAAGGDCVDNVRKDLDAFQGQAEPADDVTMVALDYAGTPPGSARGFPCNREVGLVESVKFLEEELERVGCPEDVRKKFLLAFDEIGSNVISYSGAAYFTVKVAVEATPPAITLTVADSGKPFNPLDRAAPDLTMPFEQRASGGFGIFITRKLMDDVIYCRDEGKNVLTLRKSCPAEGVRPLTA